MVEAWADIQYEPLPESEILKLNLSDEYRHIYGLLYTVKNLSERSERVLDLTTHAIKLNVGNPTAWMLRRDVVISLSKENHKIWNTELGFLSGLMIKKAKAYQPWEHRRFVASHAGMLQAEFGFVDIILNGDAKNYHAWAHRQWLVREHNLVENELAATEWFLQEDVRNNSAWNHRWLVTEKLDCRNETEMNFALTMMQKAPRNEAPWNYIRALGECVGYESAREFASNVLKRDPACVSARRFLVLTSQDPHEVQEHCQILMSIDKIRSKYWKMQLEAAQKLLER